MAGSRTRPAPSEILDRLRARLGQDLLEAEEVHGDAVVRVPPERYREIALTLRDDEALDFDFFDFIAGVDWQERGFDVVAHLYSTRKNWNVRLRVAVDRESPTCPTISDIYPGAMWHERETWELFGIRFDDHPQLVKLLLPEEFEGFPLRKDFTLMSRVAKPWPGAETSGGEAEAES